ncbi:phosphoenolpyruvate--protein phosphotransferase [Chelatococcus reniformis]|uniref:phosphoenolpyruvate--protein phosphotransferase n=2 Tax=Chelatococcus reniformis TaxID=1494448 RepID=A0A916TYT8_9HYPH|nr:phosphoenolpyruvate--protein phosphotransferase [Chelatococcus reniformis]
MAEPVSAQEKLDRIVVLIAGNMVAEVCSVYVLRADNNLELYATEGLKPEAVHRTVISTDEGLVGLIASSAEPLALSDAQSHPAFSYKPETGEEIYHSFLGVPVLRAGNTLGVLVVQNRAYRVYTEEEIEALQTTTMVMAEMVASGDVQALAPPGQDIAVRRPLALKGVSLADGIGLGYVVLHEPRIIVQRMIAEDVNQELVRLDRAVQALRASIDRLLERGDVAHHGEHRDVLETVRMFANDQGWLRRIREAVISGLTAEGAVERVQSDTRARMLRQTDPYLRDRLHDLDEIANRLLHSLAGTSFGGHKGALPDNAILVARSMGPAALLDYDRSRLRGLVLEEGGPTSHIAIVARALGIPAVGEVANIVGIVETGDAIIVDGTSGDVQVRPQANVEAAYAEKARLRARRQEQYRRLRDLPAVTRDGVAVSLSINAGLIVDMPHLTETAAEGVGLFRTELQFMVAERLPSTSEQQALYEQVLAEANGAPVTFRTLDIGGDKILPYMEITDEENPALGWRAIRIGLDRPALLRSQVRALLKAAAGRELRIMFPMVATVDEFLRAKAIVGKEKAYLKRHGYPKPSAVALGVMIEVPSLLFQLEEICREADFVSIGSNDLMQFLFAADRENRQVAGRFDPLSPAGLRALRMIVTQARQHECSATVCGEMGGRPLEAMALIGLGYRGLSMPPAAVGPVKAMILELDVGALTKTLDEALRKEGSVTSLRARLETFAADNAIPI